MNFVNKMEKEYKNINEAMTLLKNDTKLEIKNVICFYVGEKKVKSYDEAVEEKEERLDDTGDGGDTCFLKNPTRGRAGRKNFLISLPPAYARDFLRKCCHRCHPVIPGQVALAP